MLDKNEIYQQAIVHLEDADYPQAIALFEYLRASGDLSLLTRAKLLTAYLRASAKVMATSATETQGFLDLAQKLDPDNENVLLGFIRFMRLQGRHDEADEREDEFLKRPNIKIERRFLLARIARDTRQYKRAARHLDDILALDPGYTLASAMQTAVCYNAGLTNHPVLISERKKFLNPVSFTAGLSQITRDIGAVPGAKRAEGQLPDRSAWTDAQRFDWGRRVDLLIRDQLLGDEKSLNNLWSYVRPFELPATLTEKPSVILLLHFGSIHLALSKLIAAKLSFRHVTNSMHLGIVFPERIINLSAIPANTLLTHMALALRRGSSVTAALDGPVGQRAAGFRVLDTDYSIAAGPLVLAQHAKVKTHLLIAGHDADKMYYRWVEGPSENSDFEQLRDFWAAAIQDEADKLTRSGPENYIQHASSRRKAMTVVPFRPGV